jgi:hypothetical protein
MKAIAVTPREQLDRLRCSSATCDHQHDHELILLPRCHPDYGLAARYEAGILTLSCAECEAFIVAIEVK